MPGELVRRVRSRLPWSRSACRSQYRYRLACRRRGQPIAPPTRVLDPAPVIVPQAGRRCVASTEKPGSANPTDSREPAKPKGQAREPRCSQDRNGFPNSTPGAGHHQGNVDSSKAILRFSQFHPIHFKLAGARQIIESRVRHLPPRSESSVRQRARGTGTDSRTTGGR